jgi:putative tricarboxylic transport membrane protein
MAAIFGLIGFAMIRFSFPIAPVIIGVVLGAKVDFNLRVSLLMSGGDASILFTRPIGWILIVLTILVLSVPVMRYVNDYRQARRTRQEAAGSEQ